MTGAACTLRLELGSDLSAPWRLWPLCLAPLENTVWGMVPRDSLRSRFRRTSFALVASLAGIAVGSFGCTRVALPPAQPVPGVVWLEEGVASWYGNPFHGRQTASGEIYDMEALTAAHRTLPFGTVLRVQNLDNGRMTIVRINDRGPFVRGRDLDLSRRAARELEMLGPGTARVRLTVVDAATSASPNLGAPDLS